VTSPAERANNKATAMLMLPCCMLLFESGFFSGGQSAVRKICACPSIVRCALRVCVVRVVSEFEYERPLNCRTRFIYYYIRPPPSKFSPEKILLLGVNPFVDALQLTFGLTRREGFHVVVVRGNLNQPATTQNTTH
jgi:hypothetical protein